jgi:aspartate/methionine/tyrosine aminotransferase
VPSDIVVVLQEFDTVLLKNDIFGFQLPLVGVFTRLHFRRMPLEEWFDDYQYEIEHDIGESGVKYLNLAALEKSMGNVELRYGHHRGNPELRTLVCEQYEGLDPDRICVTTGSSEANFSVIVSLVGDSDHMIVEHPNYPSLYEVPRSLDLDHDLFHLTYEENFEPNIAKLEQLMKSNTRLVSLTHPNNPAGSVISERRLRDVLELVESNDAYLLNDETYRELSFEKPPPPAAVLSDHAISITTMSKAYGLPGIRIGWVAGPKHVVESVRAVREQVTICNNALGEAIAFSVLERGETFLENIRNQVRRNFEALKQWMNRQEHLEWIEPRGGVVAFPRLRNGASTEELCRILVTKYRTFTIPGYCFDMNQHMRLGFGGSPQELDEGLTKLKQAMDEHVLPTT